MNFRIIILSFVAVLVFTATTHAQTKFYLDGLGRAIIQHDQLDEESALIASDTSNGQNLTPRRSTGGYTLFDLGANIEKGESFKATAILRAKNEFGLFFGEGANFEFRRILIEGVVGSGVKYELGDIDVKLTPYTVFNNDFMNSGFESDLFGIRRQVLEYENFNNGNHWRLQGLQSYTTVLFGEGTTKLQLKGFATRTNATDYNITPDRVLAGVRANLIKGDLFELGINYTGYLDIPLESSTVDYSNHVITVDPKVMFDLNDDMKLGLLAEAGISSTSWSINNIDSLSKDTSDSFFDVKLQYKYEPYKLTFEAGYKGVGQNFNSPGAQTRRIDYNPETGEAEVFGVYYSDTTAAEGGYSSYRNIDLYDRLTQESVYNQAISASLMNYNPIYNNLDPYGQATPNRQGLYLNLTYGDDESAIYAKAGYQMMSEITSTNGVSNRDFNALMAGVKADFKKMFDMNREANITLGYMSQTTTRDDATTSIDLTSSLIDAGLTFEFANNLDLLVGAKLFSASGNEYSYSFEQVEEGFYLNQVEGVSAADQRVYDVTENMISFGLRARFSENSFVTLNYNMVNVEDSANESMSYDRNQLYANYTIKF